MGQKNQYFTIGNVISETINLYTNNFLPLWLPYILVFVPANLLVGYLQTRVFTGIFFQGLSTLISSAVASAVGLYIIIAALGIYREKPGSSEDNMEKSKGLLVSFLLLQLLVYLGIAGGFFLLIVPGIIFSLRWTVCSVVFVEEGLGIKGSMKRSRALTKGFKGAIFVIFLLIALIGLTIFSIFSAIAGALSGGFGGFFDTFTALSTDVLSVTNILYSAFSSILSPLYPLLTVVMYFNIKKEKEGYTAEELAGSFLRHPSQGGRVD